MAFEFSLIVATSGEHLDETFNCTSTTRIQGLAKLRFVKLKVDPNSPRQRKSLIFGSLLVILLLFLSSSTLLIPSAAATSGHGRSAPFSKIMKTKSGSWAGYVITGPSGSVTVINGSWVVPAVSCPSTGDAVSYEGIGIDTYSDLGPLNGVGTREICTSGVAAYSSWYTLEVAGGLDCGLCAATVFPSPGDTVTAEVAFASGSISLSLKDVTSGTQYLETQTVSQTSPMESAEWVVFQFSFTSASLANFGKWKTGSDHTGLSGTDYATISGQTGTIKSFTKISGLTVSEVTLVDGSNNVMASPSALSKDGTSFILTWKAGT